MDYKFISRELQEEKVCVVVGTRPGIIKMSPIIRELVSRETPFFIVHTGQHYSYNMDRKFFEDLEIPQPQYYLDVVKDFKTHASQTAEMMKGVEEALLREKPKAVLVGGDANTNLSGALSARKLGLIVGHVEAGLRSNDWRMPEEHNRVMIDHISELLFPPTEKAKDNLLAEKVRGEIFPVGNTVVDAVIQNKEIALRKGSPLKAWGLSESNYLLLTIHREENVDNTNNQKEIINTIQSVSRNHPELPIIFPIHPRTVQRFENAGLLEDLRALDNLKLVDPVGYLDFMVLMANASAVITDSGGIQEESCILKVPCITIRENTERPESVEVGANIVAGTSSERVLIALKGSLNKEKNWENPFGDGRASERIMDIVAKALKDEINLVK